MSSRLTAGLIDDDVVPLREHAALAAQAIAADEDVRRISLFGSVAAHCSTPNSDIDLIVVYEDIDYLRRHQVANRMADAGSQAAGWDVDVLLTDVPELEWRRKNVRSSFENKVLAEAVTLIDRPIRPERVRADKQIGAETTDAGEAASRLGDTCEPLEAMTSAMSASVVALRQTTAPSAFAQRLSRRHSITVIRNAAMVLESAIKSLHHSQGGTWPDKTSDPWDLAVAVPGGEAKRGVTEALDRLAEAEKDGPDQSDLTHSDWRWPGPRMMDVPNSWWHTPARALRWATTAGVVAKIALDAVDEQAPERLEAVDAGQCLVDMQRATTAWMNLTADCPSLPG